MEREMHIVGEKVSTMDTLRLVGYDTMNNYATTLMAITLPKPCMLHPKTRLLDYRID